MERGELGPAAPYSFSSLAEADSAGARVAELVAGSAEMPLLG